MNKLIYSLMILLLVVITLDAAKLPRLIFDRDVDGDVVHFRTTLDRNFVGFENLKASGSGQLDEKDMRSLQEIIPLGTQLIIVDLRDEFHGFINGRPFYSNRRAKVNDMQRYLDWEQDMMNQLSVEKSVTIFENKGTPKVFEKPLLETEREITEKLGITSVVFPFTSLQIPPDEIIDAFIEFVDALTDNTWVHFHCRQGAGRTSIFFIMYDMLQNANRVSKQDIIKRHFQIGGANIGTKEYYAPHRQLLNQFYHFSKQRLYGKRILWSEFINTHLSS